MKKTLSILLALLTIFSCIVMSGMETFAACVHGTVTSVYCNDEQHENICSKCFAAVNKENHTFGGYTTIRTATCSQTGIKTRRCDKCGFIQRVDIPMTSHKWDTNGKCSACGVESKLTFLTVQQKDIFANSNRNIRFIGDGQMKLTCDSNIENISISLSSKANNYNGKPIVKYTFKNNVLTIQPNQGYLKIANQKTYDPAKGTDYYLKIIGVAGGKTFTRYIDLGFGLVNLTPITASATYTTSTTKKAVTLSFLQEFQDHSKVGGVTKTVSLDLSKVGTQTFYVNHFGKNGEYKYKVVPKGTTISLLTATKGGFKATWKKQASQTTGYQIQYSTNNKFTSSKTATVSKNSTISKTISGLSKGKKYYVHIRTYKTIGNTKYYSSWSAVKSITTKK